MPAWIIVGLLCGAPGRAAAAEGELVLSLTPVYSIIKWDQRQPSGGGGVFDATYGLTEALSLRGTIFYTAQAADADPAKGLPSGIMSVGGSLIGLSFAFDVLRVIPYIDIGIGALLTTGAGQKDSSGRGTFMDFGVEVGIGADYLVSRTFSLGLVARYYAFLTNLSNIPVYLWAGPRIAWRWD
ncbi:MAG TPA: hypothetical protein VGQ83_34315 [Polyangia bacterium]